VRGYDRSHLAMAVPEFDPMFSKGPTRRVEELNRPSAIDNRVLRGISAAAPSGDTRLAAGMGCLHRLRVLTPFQVFSCLTAQ